MHARQAARSARLLGSGTARLTGEMVVCDEKLVTVVVPSRFTSTMDANPLVTSVVRAGTVPAASENMLKANLLPDVPPALLDVLTSNESVVPYLKASK